MTPHLELGLDTFGDVTRSADGQPLSQPVLAVIGGDPRRFRPYVGLYHGTLAERGVAPLPVGVHSPGHIASTDEMRANPLNEPSAAR